MRNSNHFRGWEPAEFTSVNPNDATTKETKEGFNWGYETELDPTGGDGAYVELDGTRGGKSKNLWPSEEDLPGFHKGIAKYYGKVCLHSILSIMSLSHFI